MRKLFCILILALTSTLAYAQRPDQIELPCPAGSSPTWMGQSYDQATGKYRQWQCVQQDGTVTQAIADSGNGGQVYNVRAYGAKCDGSTDDYTAIQAAINAAETVNGIVFIPSATCISSQPLLINKQITLKGTIHQLGYVKSQIVFTGNGGGSACTPGINGELKVQYSDVAVVGVYLSMAASQANVGTCVVNVSNTGNGEVSGFTMRDAGVSGGSTTTTNQCLMVA